MWDMMKLNAIRARRFWCAHLTYVNTRAYMTDKKKRCCTLCSRDCIFILSMLLLWTSDGNDEYMRLIIVICFHCSSGNLHNSVAAPLFFCMYEKHIEHFFSKIISYVLCWLEPASKYCNANALAIGNPIKWRVKHCSCIMKQTKKWYDRLQYGHGTMNP